MSKFGGLWAKIWVKIGAVEAKLSKFSPKGVLWTDSFTWNVTLANYKRGMKKGLQSRTSPYPLSRSMSTPLGFWTTHPYKMYICITKMGNITTSVPLNIRSGSVWCLFFSEIDAAVTITIYTGLLKGSNWIAITLYSGLLKGSQWINQVNCSIPYHSQLNVGLPSTDFWSFQRN